RQPDLLELRREARLVELLYEHGEGGQEPAALLHALAVGFQARVALQVVGAELAAEDLPLRVGDHADEAPAAVGGLEDAVDAPGRALDRHRRRRLAGELELRHVLGDEVRGALEERAGDALAAPRGLALAQGGEDSKRGE